MLSIAWIVDFCSSGLRLSTPLIFAALAALITEKAGMFNMGVEGMMLCSALGAVAFADFGGSVWVGLLSAVFIGLISSFIIAFFYLSGKADLYLTCIAFNLAATGGTVFFMYLLTGDKASTSGALKAYKLPNISIPLLRDIPIVGKLLFEQNLLTYLAFAAVFLIWFMLKRTRLGLRLRSVGENPHAAESVGVSVKRISYTAWAIAGILSGLGGAFMSMGWVAFFMRNMVNGRGYIGLSAMTMANLNPIGSAFASLFFGFTDAIATSLKAGSSFPSEFVEMIPYAATILSMVLLSVLRTIRHKKHIAVRTK